MLYLCNRERAKHSKNQCGREKEQAKPVYKIHQEIIWGKIRKMLSNAFSPSSVPKMTDI